MNFSEKDLELINIAKELIQQRYIPKRQVIGAAIRTKSGKIFSAVNLDTNLGRAAVCAESIAMGMVVAQGGEEVDTIVAVSHLGEIVSPCGICREMICDYAPEAFVIVPSGDGPEKVVATDLLPNKYKRKKK
jgi:cytidine deaminase